MEFVTALDVSMGKSYTGIYQNQTCFMNKKLPIIKRGSNSCSGYIQSLPGKVILVFELTGIYSKPVETFCQKNGLPYCLLNPLAAKNNSNGIY